MSTFPLLVIIGFLAVQAYVVVLANKSTTVLLHTLTTRLNLLIASLENLHAEHVKLREAVQRIDAKFSSWEQKP